MKNFKTLMLVSGFTLLAACGKPPADKFVGEWVDPTPKKVEKNSWFPEDSKDLIIKASSANKVEVTMTLLRSEKKMIFEVEGNNIISGNKVLYTLDGDKLVIAGNNKVRLVRKK